MHLRRRWVVVTAAWATPLAWITITLFSGPSDGTVVSSPTAWVGAARWDETSPCSASTVTPGCAPATWSSRSTDTRSRSGRPRARRRTGRWVNGSPTASGDPHRGWTAILVIEVTLRRYPVASAVSRNPATLLGVVGLLVAASFIYWRRPRDPAALAVLVAASAVTAGVTAYPLGTGAIDLAGGRGVWPQAGGEIAWAVASRRRPSRRR